jgi:hypothetical protein
MALAATRRTFAHLLSDLFLGISDAFALIHFRAPERPDLGRHLTDLLFIDPFNGEVDVSIHADIDPLGNGILNGVRIPKCQGQVPPLDLGPVSDSHDLKAFSKALCHPDHEIGDEGSGQTVQGSNPPLFIAPADTELTILQAHQDPLRDPKLEDPLGSLHSEEIALQLDPNALRDGYGQLSNSRHLLTFMTRQGCGVPQA